MNDDLLVKYEKELDLRYKFQNENDALRGEVERLEGKIEALKLQTENHLATVTHSAEQLQRRLTQITTEGITK